MSTNDRAKRTSSFRVESLESRNLLSLIGSKPTLSVIDSPGVRNHRGGGVYITQPTTIQVVGTAQPGPPGSAVQVEIFAQDSAGNLVNGGAPLATVVPDALGRYRALVTLPSMLPKDVNFLVARETASATQVSQLAINGTTVSGITGTLAINPGTLTNLTGTVSNPANTITGLGGTITTPATPISNIAGTITIPTFPIVTPGGPGTAGPAVGSITGGSGTLGAQVATLSGGTGTIGATTSTFTQTGSADESARTGTFTQTGTATIAPTTGTATTELLEVAVSDPVTVYIHVPRGPLGLLSVNPGNGALGARGARALRAHRVR